METPFTQEQLDGAWDEFSLTLRTTFPHIYSTMKGTRPLLGDWWNITVKMGNKVLEDEFNQRKPDLMEFLRTRLKNSVIRLQTEVSETLENHRPYTDKEKFEEMATRNPVLRNLREELDLEIEY